MGAGLHSCVATSRVIGCTTIQARARALGRRGGAYAGDCFRSGCRFASSSARMAVRRATTGDGQPRRLSDWIFRRLTVKPNGCSRFSSAVAIVCDGAWRVAVVASQENIFNGARTRSRIGKLRAPSSHNGVLAPGRAARA